jgi:hypothetical protein
MMNIRLHMPNLPKATAFTAENHRVANEAKKVGLNINRKKTKIMWVNTARQEKIVIDGEMLEDVDRFCYLGSMTDKNGGAEKDVKTRTGKPKTHLL